MLLESSKEWQDPPFARRFGVPMARRAANDCMAVLNGQRMLIMLENEDVDPAYFAGQWLSIRKREV